MSDGISRWYKEVVTVRRAAGARKPGDDDRYV